MLRSGKVLMIVTAIAFICGVPVGGFADSEKLTGMVVGRTGEVLHISVPQPVREGAFFDLKTITTDPPIANARVISCTQERPYIALAKVVQGDMETTIPTGARAYTNVDSVGGADVPKPMKSASTGNNDRFSIQAGAFYPSSPALRENISEYWQSYRMNYSLLKIKNLDAVLSAEYAKGTGSSSDGQTARSMEVIPVTMLGRLKAIRMGGMHLFIGAAGGMYQIRSEERTGVNVTSESSQKPGYELAAGLESKRGWVLELRYRDVGETQLQGYSLALGGRF